jgi:hypothetical protein
MGFVRDRQRFVDRIFLACLYVGAVLFVHYGTDQSWITSALVSILFVAIAVVPQYLFDRPRRGRWRRAPTSPVQARDWAERLTGTGRRGVAQETADLRDEGTVRQWLAELGAARDQQVLIHRSWGTVAAVADGRRPVAVVLSDGDHSWSACRPSLPGDDELSADQVTALMIEALTSESRPAWPEWRTIA